MKLDHTFLNNKRISTDIEADQIVRSLAEEGNFSDLYELLSVPVNQLADYRSEHQLINEFIEKKPEIPQWLDPDRLEKASRFYLEYASEIMMLLGAVSLPTCYAASPGNKVLYLSEKIRKKPGKRLLETASFIILISEPGAFDMSGPGYKAVQQIRLIHALVRFHLLKSEEWNANWRKPANEEDMAGTNLAFSFVVLKALLRTGFKIPEDKLNAYLHLWKWVGYLMKIDERLLTDRMEDAAELDRWIRKRNFKKSREGELLARALIDHYREALPQGLNKLVESQIRYFIGNELSDIIGLKSSLSRNFIIHSIAIFQEIRNRWLPHEPSYEKMIRDHKRLKKMYEVE